MWKYSAFYFIKTTCISYKYIFLSVTGNNTWVRLTETLRRVIGSSNKTLEERQVGAKAHGCQGPASFPLISLSNTVFTYLKHFRPPTKQFSKNVLSIHSTEWTSKFFSGTDIRKDLIEVVKTQWNFKDWRWAVREARPGGGGACLHAP